MDTAKPWYQSTAIMGALAALIMAVATQFHLLPTSITQDQILNFLLIAVPTIVAIGGRATATTLIAPTAAKAAQINAASAPKPSE
jgi:prolipoprotein diacylglyceryltransferase